MSRSSNFDRGSLSAGRAAPGGPDPLGPFTPEAEVALQEAKEARDRWRYSLDS